MRIETDKCNSCGEYFDYTEDDVYQYETMYDGDLVIVDAVKCPHCGYEVVIRM